MEGLESASVDRQVALAPLSVLFVWSGWLQFLIRMTFLFSRNENLVYFTLLYTWTMIHVSAKGGF